MKIIFTWRRLVFDITVCVAGDELDVDVLRDGGEGDLEPADGGRVLALHVPQPGAAAARLSLLQASLCTTALHSEQENSKNLHNFLFCVGWLDNEMMSESEFHLSSRVSHGVVQFSLLALPHSHTPVSALLHWVGGGPCSGDPAALVCTAMLFVW